MSFRKVLILVEGQTEESFVKHVLSKYMPNGLLLQPVVVATKRINSGGKFKGGVPSYSKVKNEVQLLLRDSSAILVTTMLDYYALPASFPGRSNPSGNSPLQRVESVEAAWTADVGISRFRAYLSLHEFEALLFAQPAAIADEFNNSDMLSQLNYIRNTYDTPEDINDAPTTAPSARLRALFGNYSKPLYGTRIATNIGLSTIMKECPHFAEWAGMLQKL